MDDHTYVRTIAIPVDGISGTNFNLNANEADKLYQNGRNAALSISSQPGTSRHTKPPIAAVNLRKAAANDFTNS
ncbi:MAG TPA: hypothetical protein VNE38_17840 [Ktedonobacteraceae bacterium]|nr:hypothetical protein [Ktedonobacteraceae bacterium]